MTRRKRKALQRHMLEQAIAWPRQLREVPACEWPPARPGVTPPNALWRSRDYLVQRYAAPSVNGVEVRRLSINRVTLTSDGQWEQHIPWEDLQRCKRETGHGEWYAVEVYPRDRDVVHVANMRHLWLLAEPLAIGWFEGFAE